MAKQFGKILIAEDEKPLSNALQLRLGANKYYTKADFRLDAIIGDIRKYLDQKELKGK